MREKILGFFACILFIINFVIPGIVIVTSADPISDELCEAVDNCDLNWSTLGDANWFGQFDSPYFYGHDCAESGIISDNQYTEITTNVTGPGILEFYWNVSSELNYDYLSFYIDGVLKDQISGEVNWQKETYVISTGFHGLTWEYKKDGSVDSGSDCGWIDYVVFTETVSLCEAVDNCDLNWSTLGEANWFGQTTISRNDGDAAQSGAIDHGYGTMISTTVVGPGVLEFYWKVSSEEDNDFLKFWIGDSLLDEISGEKDWQKMTYNISDGPWTLWWDYNKGLSNSSGSDCGWLDFITFTTPTEGPDLIVTDIWNVSNVIHFRIENIGNRNTNRSHYTALIIDGEYKVSELVTEDLAPGEQYNGYFNYNWICTPSNDDIEVVADYEKNITELNETNNRRIENWICENNPPYPPSNPNPEDKEININVNTNLSWTGGDPDPLDTITYDIYFGNFTPPPKIESDHSFTTYDPGKLNLNITYHWRIVARDNHGASTEGPIWQFTTTPINNPPYPPSNPNPEDKEININVNTNLSWTGGDPDPLDTITYDIYFGNFTPPPKIESDHSFTTYDPGKLNLNITYHWRIVARDNHGASTEGPIWQFTTTPINNPPYQPNNINPMNNSTKIDRTINLKWIGDDPDGDPVTFDVYFGATYPLPKVSWNQTTTSYNPGKMDEYTTYYWKIVAWDPYGLSNESEIWMFSTGPPQDQFLLVPIIIIIIGGPTIIYTIKKHLQKKRKKKKKPDKDKQDDDEEEKKTDYLISAVKYNKKHSHIVKVKTHEYKDKKIKKSYVIEDRETVLNNLHNKKEYHTAIKNKYGRWLKGGKISIIKINNKEFIKTDNNKTQVDNLEELPEF